MDDSILIGFMVGFIVGAAIVTACCYGTGNEVIQTETLDELCQKEFGIEYIWDDFEIGTETKIHCTLPPLIPPIPPIEDERPIVKD